MTGRVVAVSGVSASHPLPEFCPLRGKLRTDLTPWPEGNWGQARVRKSFPGRRPNDEIMTLAPVKFIAEMAQNSANSVAYVLDDDSEICALISRMLQAEGFVAVPFTNPDLCLRQLKTSDDYSVPKIIVLDLSLGKTDAIEVLNQLNILKYKGRVLLISGKDESALLEIERMGSSRGLMMLPSLKKPFRKDDLTKRLKIELDPVKPSPKQPVINSSMAALDRAVSGGGVVRCYQAIIDLKSGSVRGAEVMLHERHPSDGLIPLATSSVPSGAPIFHPLSRLLLRTALEDWLQHLSDLRTPIRLYIKLPLSVVTTTTFLSLVRETLSPHPQFPGLVIEVNDWRLFNDLKIIREVSAQLKLYGVGLAVDDIGAVYSAITESYKFPFAEFRLNSNFISNCSLNETKQAVCRDAINLVHNAGASVCAEGVANSDELETLIEMKCDTAQGYLFGVPQPIEIFKTKLLVPTPPQKANADSNTASFEWPEANRNR